MLVLDVAVTALTILTTVWLIGEINGLALRSVTRLAIGLCMLLVSQYVGFPSHSDRTWHQIVQFNLAFILYCIGIVQVWNGLRFGVVEFREWLERKRGNQGVHGPVRWRSPKRRGRKPSQPAA